MVNAISRYGVRVVPGTEELVADLDRRGQLVEGPQVAEFQAAFAARVGATAAVATSYGRMAFYYILRAMELPAGGEIVMPALTFWVMPEMARVAGLTPVFADVDPLSFNMTAESFERVVTPRTVAVVPTHLWGLPCDMDQILEVAGRHHVPVIEDCAHALGATYRGRSVGSIGDAAVFSFQTLKPLNTYGGGMAVARDPVLASRIADLAEAEPMPDRGSVHGKLRRGRLQRFATAAPTFTWTLFPVMYACAMAGVRCDTYFWESIRPLEPMPGDYRERYSNVQAALGLRALLHLDQWTRRTRLHASQMSDGLRGAPGLRLPTVPDDRTHAFYQYCAYAPERDAVVDYCLRRGVDVETLHVDVCSDLDLFGTKHPGATPGALAATQTVQIPIYEALSHAQVERVAGAVRDSAYALQVRTHAFEAGG